VPILGSGDLFSPLDVIKFLSFSKADGVLIARGAIHNPGIFTHKEKIWQAVTELKGISELEIWKNLN
jgi:tRNA-dihydrouridine synthase